MTTSDAVRGGIFGAKIALGISTNWRGDALGLSHKHRKYSAQVVNDFARRDPPCAWGLTCRSFAAECWLGDDLL